MSLKLLLLLYLTKIIISLPRKTEELSDDIVLIHLNDVHCGINDKIGYDGFVLYRRELQKNINM